MSHAGWGMSGQESNFDFLKSYDAQLVRLGALAERYFKEDPNTCLIKLRQFGLPPVSRTPSLGAIVKPEVAYGEAEFQS